jgi:hypothetical protein
MKFFSSKILLWEAKILAQNRLYRYDRRDIVTRLRVFHEENDAVDELVFYYLSRYDFRVLSFCAKM